MLVDITLKITREMLENATDLNSNALNGHLGTHFDVMDKTFPLEYVRRKAIVFDVSSVKDREIGISDIDLDLVKEDMFVGLASGFIEKEGYGSDRYRHESPVLSYELIEQLVEKKISIIGIDFAGVRRGKEHSPMDQYCADHGVFIIENLWGLRQVTGECVINTYPLNYEGMSGLPCRVIAEI